MIKNDGAVVLLFSPLLKVVLFGLMHSYHHKPLFFILSRAFRMLFHFGYLSHPTYVLFAF